MDLVSENLVGSDTADQGVINRTVNDNIAADRLAHGLSSTGGRRPCERTLKNYKAIAGTGPNAKIRSAVFTKSDARLIAGKSVMSNVSFEIGLGALLYHLLPSGDAPRSSLVRDLLAEKVQAANGGAEVRHTPALPHPPLTHVPTAALPHLSVVTTTTTTRRCCRCRRHQHHHHRTHFSTLARPPPSPHPP